VLHLKSESKRTFRVAGLIVGATLNLFASWQATCKGFGDNYLGAWEAKFILKDFPATFSAVFGINHYACD